MKRNQVVDHEAKEALGVIEQAITTMAYDTVPEILGRLETLRGAAMARIVTGPPKKVEGDRLLDAKEAATVLGSTKHWLYKNSALLPFTVRLAAGTLRFSEAGLQRYIKATMGADANEFGSMAKSGRIPMTA